LLYVEADEKLLDQNEKKDGTEVDSCGSEGNDKTFITISPIALFKDDNEKHIQLEDRNDVKDTQLNVSQDHQIIKGDIGSGEIENISPGNQKEKSFEDELLYQEKLLQKDKELFEKEKLAQNLDHNIQALKNTINAKNSNIGEMEKLLHLYDKTIREMTSERKTTTELDIMEKDKLVRKNDQIKLDIVAAEQARIDVQRKVERNKEAIDDMKKKEDLLFSKKAAIKNKILLADEKYANLKNESLSRIESANKVIEDYKSTKDSEILKLQTMLRRAEMHVSTLEDTMNQKITENENLSKMCDELCSQISQKENAKIRKK